MTGHAVNQVIWGQFEKQKSRGVQGFGAFDGQHIFKTPKIGKMRGWMKNKRNLSDFIMFHHRFPTSTINVRRAAHPFSTREYFGKTKYVLVHNGHISNSHVLKKDHDEMGIEYSSVLDNKTFNDSESLLWDVALTLEGKQEKLKAYGGIAFVAAKLVNNEITHLYFGKNAGRPLHLYRENDGVLLSSEGPGEDIDDQKLYTYNYKLNRLTNKNFKIPQYNPDYQGYGGVTKPYSSAPAYSGGAYTPGSVAHRNASAYDRFYDSWEDRDYYIDTDGRTVYIEEEFSENTETFPIPDDNIQGKSDTELTEEEYEQDYFLSTIPPADDMNIRIYKTFALYMVDSFGLYDDAYVEMQDDYEKFGNHAKSPKRELILKLLEGAMKYLWTHPGYEDMNSVNEYYENQGIALHAQRSMQTQLALGEGGDE